MYFVFAAIWAFGGALVEKDGIDYRRRFDKWWKGQWTAVKMPGLPALGGNGQQEATLCSITSSIAQFYWPTPRNYSGLIAGKGSVYDYYVSPKTAKFAPWAELVTDVAYNSETTPMGAVFVPTPETASLRFFLDIMVRPARSYLRCAGSSAHVMSR